MELAAGRVVLLGPILASLLGCGPVVDTEGEGGGGSATSGADPTSSEPTGSSSGEEPSGSRCWPAASCESCESWRVEYQGDAELDDAFSGLVIAPNGDVITFGTENRERVYLSKDGQGLVVRYSPDGDRIWTRAFFDAEAQVTVGAATFDASGVLVVATGVEREGEGSPEWESRIVRLDDAGEPLGPDTVSPRVVAELVRAGPDVLVHSCDLEQPLESFLLERLEADGSLTVVLDAGSLAVPDLGVTSVVEGPDGGLYLGGSTNYDDPWMAKTVAGEVVWSVEDVPDVAEGWINSLAVLPDGSVIYSASAQASETGIEPVVGRLSAEGESIWSRRHPASGCCANGLGSPVLDDAGRLFLVGAFGLANDGLGTRVVSIDPCDGEPQWTWDYTEGNLTNFSGGLGVDGDRLFVSGHMAKHHGNGRAWLVRLDL